MGVFLPASNEQKPDHDKGRPYDAGFLFDNTFFVGFEFKILDGDVFPSWNEAQHKVYAALTESINLPLYYAYNFLDGSRFGTLFNASKYNEILYAVQIAKPRELPGSRPAVDQHEHLFWWLRQLFADSGPIGENDWLIWGADLNGLRESPLDSMLQDYPDIIWLMIMVNDGMRIPFVLTTKEMQEFFAEVRALWNSRNLGSAKLDAIESAYADAILSVFNRMDAFKEDIADQLRIMIDMEDRPSYEIT